MIVTHWPLTDKRPSPQIFDESRCATWEFRLVMSSMNISFEECQVTMTYPSQIEDSRLEFKVGLARVPLGTAPQFASEA